MVSAPDGSIWVALFGTNRLGHVDAGTGALREIELPDPGARPRRLAVDPDGRVWYTDYARDRLGVHDPRDGSVREFATPGQPSGPYGIEIGPDGRIWYNEAETGRMVAFDPSTDEAETVAIPTSGAIVRHMVVDPERRRLWLALSGTGRIGMIQFGDGRASG
jgi:virginiamycin B lyase